MKVHEPLTGSCWNSAAVVHGIQGCMRCHTPAPSSAMSRLLRGSPCIAEQGCWQCLQAQLWLLAPMQRHGAKHQELTYHAAWLNQILL